MKISPISKEQGLKVAKAALYVGISAVISYLIALTVDQPELFGIYTPIVNVVLVTIKQAFTPATGEE